MHKDMLAPEEETVLTEKEIKEQRLVEDLKNIQALYWKGKNEEAEALLGAKLKEHWGVDIPSLKQNVADYVKENAALLSTSVMYIVPNGDWSKCLNEDEDKQKFFENEASKADAWSIRALRNTHLPKIWAVVFDMKTMETDDEFYGYAYVSETGKLKHVFAQAE